MGQIFLSADEVFGSLMKAQFPGGFAADPTANVDDSVSITNKNKNSRITITNAGSVQETNYKNGITGCF